MNIFSISISEKYTAFLTTSSQWNESADFVYFLIFPFRFSMRGLIFVRNSKHKYYANVFIEISLIYSYYLAVLSLFRLFFLLCY